MSRFSRDRQRLTEDPGEKNRRPLRLYVEVPLAVGSEVALDQAQAHDLTNVMRRRVGDPVALFNGTEGEWFAHISEIRLGRGGVLEVESRARPQIAEPDIWLMMAPIKRVPIDLITVKATELGASLLWPVVTQHAVVQRVNLRRMRANAVEAAEQCRRLSVPVCRSPTALAEALEGWPAGRALLVCDERGGSETIHQVLTRAKAESWAIMVGPEGGFTDQEFALLRGLPQCRFAGLGPRILRAETVAIAALACWQSIHGDWRENPPQSKS